MDNSRMARLAGMADSLVARMEQLQQDQQRLRMLSQSPKRWQWQEAGKATHSKLAPEADSSWTRWSASMCNRHCSMEAEAARKEEHPYTQAAKGRMVQGRQAHTDSMSKGLGLLVALPCVYDQSIL